MTVLSTTATRRAAERRWDQYGEFRLMAEMDGYVMARRLDDGGKGRMPFVVTRQEWDIWARTEATAKEPRPALWTCSRPRRKSK